MSYRNLKACPIMEQTADGDTCGRCYYFLTTDGFCPRHGNVSAAVKRYTETGELTLESDHYKRREEP